MIYNGRGWVSFCNWTAESGVGGGINEIKPFITADTFLLDHLATLTSQGLKQIWLQVEAGWEIVSSTKSIPKFINFCLSVYEP